MSSIVRYNGNKEVLKVILAATTEVVVGFFTPDELMNILIDSTDLGATSDVRMGTAGAGTVTLMLICARIHATHNTRVTARQTFCMRRTHNNIHAYQLVTQ